MQPLRALSPSAERSALTEAAHLKLETCPIEVAVPKGQERRFPILFQGQANLHSVLGTLFSTIL